jgi:hypothetical protein
MICEYGSDENGFIGEDINLCYKLKKLGFDIWVDIRSTCAHIGSKVWMGDFSQFFEFLKTQK